jgi:hypothetical protein
MRLMKSTLVKAIFVPLVLSSVTWAQQAPEESHRPPSSGSQTTLTPFVPPGIDLENCGTSDTSQVLLRSAIEWASLWQRLVSHEPERPPVPMVDFEQYDLLYLTCGRRFMGWGITSVTALQGSLYTRVEVHVLEPGPDCIVPAMGCSPAYLALLPKSHRQLAFTTTGEMKDCRKP